MAHRKAGGSAKNLKDSNPKFLGIKISDGQKVSKGQIILRQRGSKFLSGTGTAMGNDHTIFALTDGTVHFVKTRKTHFTGKTLLKKKVTVE